DGINDVALGTADHWVYILYGKEDYLIEQEGGQRGQIKGKIILDQAPSSLIKATPILISLNNNKQFRISRNTKVVLLFVGVFTVLTCAYVLKKRRFQ
ncbi:MAG: hypothetical protein ACW991_07150, partial [Candidatus Hodarchaeales archaeon]